HQFALTYAYRGDRGRTCWYPRRHLLGGRIDSNFDGGLIYRVNHPLAYKFNGIWRRPGSKLERGGVHMLAPVETEGPPIQSSHIPREHIPARPEHHDSIWFISPLAVLRATWIVEINQPMSGNR